MESATLAFEIGKAVTPHAKQLLARVGQRKYDRFVTTYTNVFREHLHATVLKCSRVKSLLHRDEALDIREQYVGLKFQWNAKSITDRILVEDCSNGNIAILVTGLAGSGKSMFMKWLALQLVGRVATTQKYPLFIELRNISQENLSLPLDQMIFRQSSTDKSNATFTQFKTGLMDGMFVVIIDGLDEVPIRLRDAILQEVSDFQRRFPDATLVCSTRPSRSIEGSAGLSVVHVEPMSLSQIIDVINRAVFDEQKKEAFIKKLRDGLYEKHRSFLSNPLLATIMLITFDLSVDVPSKLSLFYSQVFEALFYKHDSSKGVYVREHYSGLEIDQFEAIFRAFCFKTYANSKLAFDMSELSAHIRSALLQTRKEDVSPTDFIKDCLESLSLLQEDGIYISFVHRSFQEYFAARFILYYTGEHYYRLVNGTAARALGDSSLQMLCEMNPEAVLKGWAIPKVSELISRFESVDHSDAVEVLNALKHYTQGLSVEVESGIVMGWTWSDLEGAAEFNALHQVLTNTGTGLTISLLDGKLSDSWNPHWDPESSEPDALPIYLQNADVHVVEGEECYEVPLLSTAVEWINDTNLPRMLGEHVQSLRDTKRLLQERLLKSDDFAREIADLFH